MDTHVRKFRIGKASTCLLFLCVTCALVSAQNETSAKKPPAGTITIDQGTANPANVNVGQGIEFSASYSTTIPLGTYALHVCKSKKISTDAFCQDGSWCVSEAFTADNPLSCNFTPRANDNGNNQYFMFVCDNQKRCSVTMPGAFTVGGRNILSLQAPVSINFKIVPFSFSPQLSADNALGDLILTSTIKGDPGWSLDVTAADWQDNKDGDTMDFDGNGNTTGQLTANLDAMKIESSDPMGGIRQGITASFTGDIQAINVATANRNGGNGTFTFKNIKFDQFVPGNQQGGGYKTILTLTIS